MEKEGSEDGKEKIFERRGSKVAVAAEKRGMGKGEIGSWGADSYRMGVWIYGR